MSQETQRPLNGCKTCNNTWYPRGKDLSSTCPACGSRSTYIIQSSSTGIGCFGFLATAGTLTVIAILGVFLVGLFGSRLNPKETSKEPPSQAKRDDSETDKSPVEKPVQPVPKAEETPTTPPPKVIDKSPVTKSPNPPSPPSPPSKSAREEMLERLAVYPHKSEIVLAQLPEEIFRDGTRLIKTTVRIRGKVKLYPTSKGEVMVRYMDPDGKLLCQVLIGPDNLGPLKDQKLEQFQGLLTVEGMIATTQAGVPRIPDGKVLAISGE